MARLGAPITPIPIDPYRKMNRSYAIEVATSHGIHLDPADIVGLSDSYIDGMPAVQWLDAMTMED